MSQLFISIIQASLEWENKSANLKAFEEKINNLSADAQLVVLPEMFSTGFSMEAEKLAETMDGETVGWMKKMAKTKRIILTGSLIIEEEGQYYNRMLWVLPNGEIGVYDKRHLFAFAGEHEHYSAGSQRSIASVNGWKINLQVCYDLRFPVWARQQFDEDKNFEYDMLIYVANWPEKRSLAWKTLLRARAIENQCYVVGVNRVGEDGKGIVYSGDSMIIDPLGEILYHKSNDEDVFTGRLNRKDLEEVRSKFPFWKDADDFQISEL